ncbi:class I SAM-dependent methyltransferase [Pseudomonas nunensis]|uniref:Class I SAM-dependent methyltransferase n=1 Tax=Pseudomonas nunensis TaxID=2961896 RepID=A0ABY5ES19_9PSED|nr:class I SAM-dependent methyltransferase [Pseudomonas nunensis]KPN91294.1 methyltransferase [Pseudomonas nunensis]MCL5230051.1 class I SAM-dependent methyltransferase [Pseudomonas nunensis]UTO17562.1 class I SAM-dependent methyltransferase [Pseudomonas nunensis]
MNPDALATLNTHLLTALATAPAETRRLFHGRGRCWPGLEQLTVDWLQGVVLVSLFKEPEAQQLEALKVLLLGITQSAEWQQSGAHTLLLQHRYLLQSTTEWLLGDALDEMTITEGGLKYRVDLGRKQNAGLFLDMRYGRDWVRANAEGKRVLNLFAYTCGFSVTAIEGGAAHVVNLDMSSSALSRGRDNHRLNGHDVSNVTFLGHDLFKSWGKVIGKGPYDLVIIDPPSFQKGSFLLTKDYQRVLRRLPELLTEQGTVLACMNDPAFGSDFLIDGVTREAPSLRFVERLENPPEFPDADVECGLKALVFRQGD